MFRFVGFSSKQADLCSNSHRRYHGLVPKIELILKPTHLEKKGVVFSKPGVKNNPIESAGAHKESWADLLQHELCSLFKSAIRRYVKGLYNVLSALRKAFCSRTRHHFVYNFKIPKLHWNDSQVQKLSELPKCCNYVHQWEVWPLTANGRPMNCLRSKQCGKILKTVNRFSWSVSSARDLQRKLRTVVNVVHVA